MASLSALLRPSPFKAGLFVVIGACVLFYSFGNAKPALLRSLDGHLTAAMFRWRGVEEPTGQVVIVDIDEKSLDRIGQWPWPRDLIGKLVELLHQKGARAIGLDILFAEPDRTSPKQLLGAIEPELRRRVPEGVAQRLKTDPRYDHDQALGQALADSPSILSYAMQRHDDGLGRPGDRPWPTAGFRLLPEDIEYGQLALIDAHRAITNIPEVALARSEGFFNVFPSPSGIVNKVPLVMRLDGLPYPSLALETVRVGLGEDTLILHAAPSTYGGRHGLLGISVGKHLAPTDDQAQMSVNYRGPVGTFDYVSAVDVLSGSEDVSLQDKYVLIGTSATGLLDLRATPFSNVFPGVEIQATAVDNLLAGDALQHDAFTEIGLTYSLIIAGGLILSAVLAYAGPILGGLTVFAFLGLSVAGNYLFFFRSHEIVGMTYSLLTALVLALVVMPLNYFFVERQKRFIQGAFNHYLSPQVVNELVRNPRKLSLAGEEKTLTVLFCDIRNFTRISEEMNSTALAAFMNDYLTEMSRIILDARGTVDKFIGDAVMAFWGAPLSEPRHADNAVRAALRMISRLQQLQSRWIDEGLPPIETGIGINTGRMRVGNFGSEQRFDYTVIGDEVNLASRIEGLNKLYGTSILVTQSTKEALGDTFRFRTVDVVRVKGKQQAVAIYEPLLEGEGPLDPEIVSFEKTLRLYRRQAFAEAQEELTALHSAHPHPLYRLYLDRIRYFRDNPPGEDWDGVSEMQVK